MKEAAFTTIHAPLYMDTFMKAADLFHHKNVGIIEDVTISYREDTKLTLDWAAKAIEHLKNSFIGGGHIVSFVHLIHIQNGNQITINDSVFPYYDKTAREISDGHKSFLFYEFINFTTPFECKISETCFIEGFSTCKAPEN